MTKTISINLGGLLFHIDDEAYRILQAYLEAVEKQFRHEPEKKDIMLDIESRIAELFAEQIDRKKDLISPDEVNAIISIMGQPHDFAEEDAGDQQEPEAKSKSYRKNSHARRMYRDTDNRLLGGVCSGLGAYFDTDPWIFRILFIVFGFFFLAGIVIYLILWIAIPEAITSAQKLEMRGQPITIENIKNAVKMEFDNVKKKMKF
jgi:phage shock protein PspC (stress-responsive transcriptional regulator)